MAEHRAVTTTIAGNGGTVVVHFHCPCGIDRQEVIVIGVDGVHPTGRFTAAIRSLHERARWPADMASELSEDTAA